MSKHLVSDALYMAQVWQTIKEHGYEFVVENGDPDGVDFVANRIIEESAQHSVQRTAEKGAPSGQFDESLDWVQPGQRMSRR